MASFKDPIKGGYKLENIEMNENQLHHEALGVAMGLNSWVANDSASRLVMYGNQLSQGLAFKGATLCKNITGVEREYAKYTFAKKMPCDARILKVIPKYRRSYGMNAVKVSEPPSYLVIFQNMDVIKDNIFELDCIEVTSHHLMHESFGFKYQLTNHFKNINGQTMLQKGTVLAKSPNVTEEGNYKYGAEFQTAFMSIPQIIEDGFVASRSACGAMTTISIGKRTGGWGAKQFPLNLYGTDDDYRPYPEIGDRIRDDGLVMAMRDYDPIFAAMDMSTSATQKVDTAHDKMIFGPPGAKIIDISVKRNPNDRDPTPVQMRRQALRYSDNEYEYHKTIYDFYRQMKREKKGTKLSRRMHWHVVNAMKEINYDGLVGRLHKTYRANPIDEWTVEITYEETIVPTIGFKITDRHGGKGVICDVWEDEWMPVDKHGVRVDIIRDGDSIVKRMNSGAVFEQYANATTAQMERRLTDLDASGQSDLAKEELLHYYRVFSPYMGVITDKKYADPVELDRHYQRVLKNGIYTFLPPNSPTIGIDQVRDLHNEFPLDFGPVRYRGRSGNYCVTESDILVGSIYTQLLEKTGSGWASVSSAKRQHFGILAKLTQSNKYSLPWREKSTRLPGESEGRLLAAYAGARMASEIINRPNDPAATRQHISNILDAEYPTDIQTGVDYTKVKRGMSRAKLFVSNMQACDGFEFTRHKLGE